MSKLNKIFLVFFFAQMILSGCTGCSKSGGFHSSNSKNRRIEIQPEVSSAPLIKSQDAYKNKQVIEMVKEGGVYKIPVQINGIDMSFIFDTGASSISISMTEATFLFKQGKLSKEDILGTAGFMDANGDISEGTIINLKEVKVGNKLLNNVEASVVLNLSAPLLFGQSALEKFGKVSIDYSKSQITFE